jgi:magnesium-transporting ATPase (P-type)
LGWFTNPLIWFGMLIEWTLIIAIIQVPFLRTIFSTAPLNSAQWVVLLLCPLLVLGAEEVRKAMVKGRS